MKFRLLIRLFTLKGRASRKELSIIFLLNSAIYIVVLSLLRQIIISENFWFYHILLPITCMFILFIPTVAVAVRRLHDINKSGWWIMLPYSTMPLILILTHLISNVPAPSAYHTFFIFCTVYTFFSIPVIAFAILFLFLRKGDKQINKHGSRARNFPEDYIELFKSEDIDLNNSKRNTNTAKNHCTKCNVFFANTTEHCPKCGRNIFTEKKANYSLFIWITVVSLLILVALGSLVFSKIYNSYKMQRNAASIDKSALEKKTSEKKNIILLPDKIIAAKPKKLSPKELYTAACKQLYKINNVEEGVTLLKKAAEANSDKAQKLLGDYYYNGTHNVTQNYIKAYNLYLSAAENGNTEAAYNVGQMQENGIATDKDPASAYQWYLKSIGKNSDASYIRLALMNFHGTGTEKDIPLALYYADKASSSNKEKADKLKQKITDSLSADQLYYLSLSYEKGSHPFTKNIGRSIELCKLAADKNSLAAKQKLVTDYLYGINGKTDLPLAFNWSKNGAVINKDPILQNQLGIMYRDGIGTEKNQSKAAYWFQRSAEKGNIDAEYNFALANFHGKGIKQSYETAFFWLDKALKYNDSNINKKFNELIRQIPPKEILSLANKYYTGNKFKQDYKRALLLYKLICNKEPEAEYKMAQMLINGKGCRKNLIEGFAYLLKSSQNGYKPALDYYRTVINTVSEKQLIEIADKLNKGIKPFKKNKQEAFYIYKTLADKGNLDYICKIADAYCYGKIVPQNFSKAFYWYKTAADKGNAAAQYHVAYLYSTGKGIPKKPKEAFYWCKRAALKGVHKAENMLGVMYRDGIGTSVNYSDAFYWFRQSANSKNRNAEYNLALAYFYGQGTSRSYDKAFYWLEHAFITDQKRDSAYQNLIKKIPAKDVLNLADKYYHGKNITKDYRKAFLLYNLISETSPKAQYMLSSMYIRGNGTDENIQKALSLMLSAAKNNYASAQAKMGLFYYDGKYVKQSNYLAYAWLKLAASNNNTQAEKLLSILKYKMNKSGENLYTAEEYYEKIKNNLTLKTEKRIPDTDDSNWQYSTPSDLNNNQ